MGFRQVLLGLFFLGMVWGIGMIVLALQPDSPHRPQVVKDVPIRALELKTTRDGVLDDAWLGRMLALPAGISLMELDLEKLRERLLGEGQVLTASLTRQFPDRLIVHITERAPVARVRVGSVGESRDWLVARDGVLFLGVGYSVALLESMPWLGGIAVVPAGRGFRPISQMDVVARLLSDAQFAAESIYRMWQVVSLARLDSDNEIEVTMKDSTTVVFGAKGGFFVQLSNLDYMMERLARLPRAKARIDLSLGREVPVMVEPLGANDAKKHPLPSTAASFFNVRINSSSKNQREL
ncbi:MAG: hypothetical protein RL077_3354 [Verrucomicrobiota bacterium]